MASTSVVARRIAGFAAGILLGLVPLAGLVSAQTGTATISGQVKDESGGVLHRVTVTAKSPALQVPRVTSVADSQGEYRLTPLPIGIYTVEYVLSGFQTVRREAIRLTAGFTAREDIQLNVGALQETVAVSGASPIEDVTSTATSTQLTKEALELVPTSRNGYIGLMHPAVGTQLWPGDGDRVAADYRVQRALHFLTARRLRCGE
jgi:hypothetical protein